MSSKSYIDLNGTYEEYIETVDQFEESLFKDVYFSLYKVLSSILERKDHRRGDIITILGERGSGKTSLLLSFVNSLMSVEKRKKFMKTVIGGERGEKICRDVNFSVMENLDASMMDSSEDIFDILLSRMLKRIDKYKDDEVCDERKDGNVRYDILQDFDDIFKIHQQIKRQKNVGSEKGISEGYSSLSVLRRFQDSLELNRKFEKLVENYLNEMFNNNAKWEEQKNYLIVPIDDLDMNSENGFERMEQIYRYIAVKNVIVIVAVKYNQIMQLAEKNGYKLYSESKIELNDNKIEYIRGYAKEYLAKLLPIQNRVYMPDMVVHQREIRGKWYTKEKVGVDAVSEKTIREKVMFKIKDKTGMCFHMCGQTMHILEAESLRELRGYYGYLDSQLKTVSVESSMLSEADREILLDNIEQFTCDFLNRIVNRRLDSIHKDKLLVLCELDYRSMGNYLIRNMTWEKKNFLYRFKSSYGELLYSLYQSSRNSQEEKQFVNAVLVFYTYIVQRERVEIIKENPGGDKDVINEIFFNSWAGSWSNYLIPKITDKKTDDGEEVAMKEESAVEEEVAAKEESVVEEEVAAKEESVVEEEVAAKEESVVGERSVTKGEDTAKEEDTTKEESVTGKDVSYDYWEPGAESFWGCIEGISLSRIRLPIERKVEKIVSARKWVKENREEIEALEWTLFFFEEFYSDENNKENIILKAEQKESGWIEWTIGNKKADFNILAFIKHSYNYEEYFNKLYAAIADALIAEAENSELKSKVEQELKKGSGLYRAYKRWEKNGKTVVPFQYTDIYYHMLSYLRNQNWDRGTVEIDYIFTTLCNLFKRINNFLKMEDEAYTYIVEENGRKRKQKQTKFTEKFISCPIVEIFLNPDKKPDDIVIKAFSKMVIMCAMDVSSSNKYKIRGTDLNTSDEADLRTYEW